MANLYENIPEMQARAAANEQRRKIAESLLVQSQDQVQPFVSTGRMVAPMSITQGLAQMLKAYYAGKGIKSANEGDKALASEHAAKAAEAIAAYKAQSQGVPERAPAPIAPLNGQGPPKPAAGPPVPAVAADPRGAIMGLLANQYAPPEAKQAAVLGENWRRDDATSAENRTWKREDLLLAQQTKLADIEARMQDRQLTRDMQAQLAAEANATRLQIAQMSADVRRDQIAATAATATAKPPPGEAAVDRKFGQDYADYVSGGAATTQQAIDELTTASEKLKTTQASGPVVGALPNWVRKRTNGPGVAIQQDIERNIQASLRQVLGAQYTQVEGENLLQRTFDPAQPETVNKERLDSLIDRLSRAKTEKDRAAEYFKTNGTLKGFTGKTDWTTGDFKPVEKSASPSGAKTVVRTGTAGGRKVVQYSDGTTEYAD